MSTNEKWFIGIVLTILTGLVVFSNWDKIRKWFNGKNGNGTPRPPAEGSSCIMPDDTTGIIVNGQCQSLQSQPRPVIKYVISNPNGAIVYDVQGKNFVAMVPVKKIPLQTEVQVISTSEDQKYVNTNLGWIEVADLAVTQ